MTVKAWYWTGLGVLILSVGSSGIGRCWMETASGVIGQLRAKTLPYMAMAEMATGHTQAGLSHMQAAQARVEAQAARLQIAQARIEADRARLEALAAAQSVKHLNILANYSGMGNFDIETPGVSVTQDRVVLQGQHGFEICPHTRMKMPGMSRPHVTAMQNPI